MCIPKTCCFCVSLQNGVYIIGVLNLLSLVPEYYYFEMTRTILTLVGVVAFFIMLANDNSFTRGLNFFAWTISMFSYYIISIFIASAENGGFAPDERAADACAGFEDEWFSNYMFRTVERCEQTTRQVIVAQMYGTLVPALLITFYSCMVLFGYWREASTAKTQLKEPMIN